MSWLVDVSPLRESPEFRRLWGGVLVSTVGSQMTLVAVPLQVYALTRSSFAVGLLGLVSLVPLMVGSLYGGAVADAVDRRKLLLVTDAGLIGCSLLLVAATEVWQLYALSAAVSGISAVNYPAGRAVVARLLRPDQLPAANALNQIVFNLGLVTGPVLAGAVIREYGYGTAYAVDAVSFLAALAAAWLLPSMRPVGATVRAGLASVVEGLGYLRGRTVLLAAFAVDVNAMVFGMPRALFPALAENRFGGGEQVAGLMFSAPAVGALAGALLSGRLVKVSRQGLAVLVAVAAWGLAIAAFGLTTALPLALLFLAVAGAADMVSAVFRMAILQAETPDALQGRLAGVHLCVVAGGPRLGDLEAGTVAALVSPAFSAVSGGLACVVGVFVTALLAPAFARYRAR